MFHRQIRRPAYSLMELVVASAAGAVLLGGMASSVYVASQALDVVSSGSTNKTYAAWALDQIVRDVRHAQQFSERTSTAITFTVPDRDNDGLGETIRYAWSGTVGDPLTYELNGASGGNLLDSIDSLDFTYLTRTIAERPVAGSDTGIVAHWLLDETSGSTAFDDTPNGHDGSYQGNPTLGVNAVHNLGTRLNGLTQYITIPDHPDLSSQTTTGMTVSAWAKVHSFDTDASAQTRQPIISKGFWSDWEWALNVYDDGRAEFTTWQADGSAHSGSIASGITLGKWALVTGTYEPNVANRLYVDGVEVASDTTFVGDPHDGSRNVQIGRREDGQFLNATIDDVRYYNRALTAPEVAALYAEADLSGVVFEEFTEVKYSSSVSTPSIDVPPGTQEGDLLIAAIAIDGQPVPSADSGWNELVINNNAGRAQLAIWWKIASASEPSSYTFPLSFADQCYGWMMRFTGHDSSNPINSSALIGDGVATTTDVPLSPEVTTSVDDCMILRMGAFDDDDINVDNPGIADHTPITMDSNTTGNQGVTTGGAAYSFQDTAGTTPTANFTLTASEEYATVTIAIAPAP